MLALRNKPAGLGRLRAQLAAYLDPTTVNDISEACAFGANAHHGQTRQSGEEFISHPLAVAAILGDLRMDGRTIIAAILHDVIEDTDTPLSQLAARFGDDVARMVDGVSKVERIEAHSKLNAEAASFRKMFMATAEDIRVIVIKLADRLHNMRTLGALGRDKQRRIAKQTMEIYAPIANRLGMGGISQELEDLGFRALYPKRHDAISKYIAANRRGRGVVREFCKNAARELRKHDIEAEVYGRKKTPYSIYRKMQQKQLPMREIRDLYAARIIVKRRELCYAALGAVHKLCKPQPGEFKDYIAIPKANGYQSLHTVVMSESAQPIEIQIRSRAMHQAAENGVASHWSYKTPQDEKPAPQQLARQWLDSLLDARHKPADSSEYFDHLKADLQPDDVYVFTPKGEIKHLPKGATVLDFAYSVHSDIGDHCVGARLNQIAVPLHEQPKNGDRVEIITAKGARPQPAWLGFTVTAKSRSSIRHHLNRQKEKEAHRLGGKLLKRALRAQGWSRLRISTSEKQQLLQKLQLRDWSQLLIDIGFGKRPQALVAKQFMLATGAREAPEDAPVELASMMIEGSERLLVTYANCCYPIAGDKIIGGITGGRGLVVHRANCPNRKRFIKHPENYFDLNWSPTTRGKFAARIQLQTRNKKGVLARVSAIIADHDANINHVNVDSKYGDTTKMSFIVEVDGRTHLARVMRRLHVETSVLKLSRA